MSPTERYLRIAEIMNEAYREYEEGLVALRKRVVEGMHRKLKEGSVLDQPRAGSTPRSAPVARHRRPRERRRRS
jgi:hypothetical protein